MRSQVFPSPPPKGGSPLPLWRAIAESGGKPVQERPSPQHHSEGGDRYNHLFFPFSFLLLLFSRQSPVGRGEIEKSSDFSDVAPCVAFSSLSASVCVWFNTPVSHVKVFLRQMNSVIK